MLVLGQCHLNYCRTDTLTHKLCFFLKPTMADQGVPGLFDKDDLAPS